MSKLLFLYNASEWWEKNKTNYNKLKVFLFTNNHSLYGYGAT